MRTWIMVTLCLLACGASRLPAGFERQPESPRSCAMGGAGVAGAGNAWGGLENPAGIADVRTRVLALGVAPSPFGIPELCRTACAYVEPLEGGAALTLTALRYGFTLYRETTMGAGCGLSCGKGIRAGALATLNTVSISGYGSGSAWGLDAGFLWEIAPGLACGCAAANCVTGAPGRSGEKNPVTITAGLACAAGPWAGLACDVCSEERFPAELRLGGECRLAGCLALRAGVSSEPHSLCAGLGLHAGWIDIDYAFSRHEELGVTHRFGLTLHGGDP